MFVEIDMAGFNPNGITSASYFAACTKFQNMEVAHNVFDKMRERNLVSWNAVFQQEVWHEEMILFFQIRIESLLLAISPLVQNYRTWRLHTMCLTKCEKGI